MASKSGMFLPDDQRQELIRTLEACGEMVDVKPIGNDTGCLICGKDDDHNNLMLCEGCNDEYHIYCLDPPLDSVPDDDWYCDTCLEKKRRQEEERQRRQELQQKNKNKSETDDGLAGMVSALPREFTSRFGEVCFAYGGFGFGWWPSCIFDPRLTEGSARHTARKNLGKKHLIYFFECHEAPFAVLSSSKIVNWTEGLSENYHLGKTARGAGKQRSLQFQQALQAAIIEEDKPLEQRLDWNRAGAGENDQQQPLLLPMPKKARSSKGKKRRNSHDDDATTTIHMSPATTKGGKRKSSSRHRRDSNSNSDTEDAAGRQKKKKKTDGPLYCRILKRNVVGNETGTTNKDRGGAGAGINIGFVKLPSTRKSTFKDARKAIVKELVPDAIPKGLKWRFHVTTLGPVSPKQEESLGPIVPFLRSGIGGNVTNGGSIGDPITIVIVETQQSGKK